jgi:short-subunit dehydrogenase
MSTERDLKGRWALVTGASSGLGADFARVLAVCGCNLVLLARREDKLARLREEIAHNGSIQVRTVAQDLLEPNAAQGLYQALQKDGISIDILINNAGIGHFGDVVELAWEKDRDTLHLNMVVLVQLSKLFARDMVARGFGRILQVASTGAYQPDPSMACYGASKAFVLSFGEALAFELAGTGVTCTVLSPGYTDTEFHQVGGQPMTWLKRTMMMESRQVADIGVRAMLRGRRSVVAGLANAVMAWSMRLLPRRLATWLSHWALDPRK